MAHLEAILQYQEEDKKLWALERELAASDERKEYAKLRKFMESAPERLDALDAKATALKSRAAELVEKYRQVEETLAEFENLDELLEGGADVSFYKKKAQMLMDKLKKLKADLTAITAEINATDAEYKALKKEVIEKQKQYAEAKAKYAEVKAAKEPERKAIEANLTALAKNVPADLMQKYQTKRKEKLFPVLVELQNSRCSKCGMELPLAAQSRLTGGGTIECDNCHHIIYNT